jgi:hypothetical protein
MSRLSIDEQLRELETADRLRREGRVLPEFNVKIPMPSGVLPPRKEKATDYLFRYQVVGLISLLEESDPVRQKLVEALELFDGTK